MIDEADRMVEKGHFLELSQLLEILNDSQYNPRRQTFVFSATLTLVHQTPTRVLQKKNAKKMDKKTKLVSVYFLRLVTSHMQPTLGVNSVPGERQAPCC